MGLNTTAHGGVKMNNLKDHKPPQTGKKITKFVAAEYQENFCKSFAYAARK